MIAAIHMLDRLHPDRGAGDAKTVIENMGCEDFSARASAPPPRLVATDCAWSLELDRWTWHRAIGTEHTAVAVLRTQHRTAVRAIVEILTGICRHYFRLRRAAKRTGNGRSEKRGSLRHRNIQAREVARQAAGQ